MKNNIVENIRLEMKAPYIKSRISVRKGDVCTRTLHITLASGGSVEALDDAEIALIMIRKPDGNFCYNDCVIRGNEIQYTITSQTINVAGECACQVQVTFNDGAVITSPEFTIVVYQPLVDNNAVKSQNEYTSLTEQIIIARNHADDAERSAKNAKESEINAGKSEDGAMKAESNAEKYEREAYKHLVDLGGLYIDMYTLALRSDIESIIHGDYLEVEDKPQPSIDFDIATKEDIEDILSGSVGIDTEEAEEKEIDEIIDSVWNVMRG